MTKDEIKFYSNGCPSCRRIKTQMDRNNVEYIYIGDMSEIMSVATQNQTVNMPFALINNEFYSTKQLEAYLAEDIDCGK